MVREIVRVAGLVSSSRVRVGTAGEHKAVILSTSEGEELILVRKGGNPFDDPKTRSLVGKRIEVEGYRLGNEIRYVRVREI